MRAGTRKSEGVVRESRDKRGGVRDGRERGERSQGRCGGGWCAWSREGLQGRRGGGCLLADDRGWRKDGGLRAMAERESLVSWGAHRGLDSGLASWTVLRANGRRRSIDGAHGRAWTRRGGYLAVGRCAGGRGSTRVLAVVEESRRCCRGRTVRRRWRCAGGDANGRSSDVEAPTQRVRFGRVVQALGGGGRRCSRREGGYAGEEVGH